MPQTPDRPDLSKVSKNIRSYIEKLETDLAWNNSKLHAMCVTGDSEVGLLDYDAPEHFRPLPPGSTIVFRLDPDAERGREVHGKVEENATATSGYKTKYRRLGLHGRDRYGNGSLAVRPQGSNTAQVFLDPDDQTVR